MDWGQTETENKQGEKKGRKYILIWCEFDRASLLIRRNTRKRPTRCNRLGFYCQNLLFAQNVSGTIMPIIRSSRVLYRWLLLVVLGALVFKLLVWCGAEGYVSGLRDYAHHQELKSIIQMVAACGTWCFGFQVVGLVWSWGLCVRFAGLCPSSGALEYIQMVAACGTFFAIKPHLLHLVGLLFLRSNYFPL